MRYLLTQSKAARYLAAWARRSVSNASPRPGVIPSYLSDAPQGILNRRPRVASPRFRHVRARREGVVPDRVLPTHGKSAGCYAVPPPSATAHKRRQEEVGSRDDLAGRNRLRNQGAHPWLGLSWPMGLISRFVGVRAESLYGAVNDRSHCMSTPLVVLTNALKRKVGIPWRSSGTRVS
jgi:hypothetical protein